MHLSKFQSGLFYVLLGSLPLSALHAKSDGWSNQTLVYLDLKVQLVSLLKFYFPFPPFIPSFCLKEKYGQSIFGYISPMVYRSIVCLHICDMLARCQLTLLSQSGLGKDPAFTVGIHPNPWTGSWLSL